MKAAPDLDAAPAPNDKAAAATTGADGASASAPTAAQGQAGGAAGASGSGQVQDDGSAANANAFGQDSNAVFQNNNNSNNNSNAGAAFGGAQQQGQGQLDRIKPNDMPDEGLVFSSLFVLSPLGTWSRLVCGNLCYLITLLIPCIVEWLNKVDRGSVGRAGISLVATFGSVGQKDPNVDLYIATLSFPHLFSLASISLSPSHHLQQISYSLRTPYPYPGRNSESKSTDHMYPILHHYPSPLHKRQSRCSALLMMLRLASFTREN